MNLQRNGEFHDKKKPTLSVITEEVEIPKAERIVSVPHKFYKLHLLSAPKSFLQWQDVWWELEHEPIEMVSTFFLFLDKEQFILTAEQRRRPSPDSSRGSPLPAPALASWLLGMAAAGGPGQEPG